MKAFEIDFPRPQMGKLPEKPGKLRRHLHSVAKTLEENRIVREFLLRYDMADQVPWVLNPPHYRADDGR